MVTTANVSGPSTGDGRAMRGAEPRGDQTSPTIRASPLLLAGPPPRTAEARAPVWGDPCALHVFSSTPGLCSLDARSTPAPVVTIGCPQTWPMSPRGQSCLAEPLCSGEALLVFLIHLTPPGQASPGPAPGTPIHSPQHPALRPTHRGSSVRGHASIHSDAPGAPSGLVLGHEGE